MKRLSAVLAVLCVVLLPAFAAKAHAEVPDWFTPLPWMSSHAIYGDSCPVGFDCGDLLGEVDLRAYAPWTGGVRVFSAVWGNDLPIAPPGFFRDGVSRLDDWCSVGFDCGGFPAEIYFQVDGCPPGFECRVMELRIGRVVDFSRLHKRLLREEVHIFSPATGASLPCPRGFDCQ